MDRSVGFENVLGSRNTDVVDSAPLEVGVSGAISSPGEQRQARGCIASMKVDADIGAKLPHFPVQRLEDTANIGITLKNRAPLRLDYYRDLHMRVGALEQVDCWCRKDAIAKGSQSNDHDSGSACKRRRPVSLQWWPHRSA